MGFRVCEYTLSTHLGRGQHVGEEERRAGGRRIALDRPGIQVAREALLLAGRVLGAVGDQAVVHHLRQAGRG